MILFPSRKKLNSIILCLPVFIKLYYFVFAPTEKALVLRPSLNVKKRKQTLCMGFMHKSFRMGFPLLFVVIAWASCTQLYTKLSKIISVYTYRKKMLTSGSCWRWKITKGQECPRFTWIGWNSPPSLERDNKRLSCLAVAFPQCCIFLFLAQIKTGFDLFSLG